MILDVPSSVVLSDGTTAAVKSVAANVVDGQFEQITYTVEKESGAWSEVASDDVERTGEGSAVVSRTVEPR